MLKNILKTFGIIVGSGVVLTCVLGLIAWRLLIGDPWAGLGLIIISCFSYPIGLIIGIVLVNKLLYYEGSLLFGILGFILGGLLAGVIMFVPGPGRLIDALITGWTTSLVYSVIAFILIIVVVPLTFTLGYCFVKKSNDTTE